MKNLGLLKVFSVFCLGLLWGCATMQTWPGSERSAQDKIIVIQEQIGDGLKTGALTPDQSQSFLTKLKVIQTDYTKLRDQKVTQDKWESILTRLDVLGDDINRASARTTTRIEGPRNGDRIVELQRRIDDARASGRLAQEAGSDFQARLDAIRQDYLRITDGGRYAALDERTDISRRLDAFETDLNRYR